MNPHQGLIDCRLCPRLVEWRERKATTEKRAAFKHEDYWGRPVPAMGRLTAPILIVGLAPAAHGGNRTGRMFTGDRSGEWVFRALHRHGLATTPDDEAEDLAVVGARITAVCHCAPPDNKPLRVEVDTCTTTWLVPEMQAMNPRVVVCLGGLAWNRVLRLGATRLGWAISRPRPRFGHGAEVEVPAGPLLLGSYHPSQQNTFTGRLTEAMFDKIWTRAAQATRG